MAPQAEDDDLKGTGSKEAEMEMKTNTQQFFHFCLLKIHVFERHKNTTVAVTILCPATYITDVINEAKLCGGKSIKYVTSQTVSPRHW